MNTFIIIDGNALIHRAFHAYPSFLTTKTGVPTNAVHGFAMMLERIVALYQPKYLAICFDTPEPTFRNKLFVEYQTNRPEGDPNLIPQFDLVHEFVDACEIKHLEQIGFEADDVIGTLATHSGAERTFILTGDKDILQLVSDRVSVLSPKKGMDDLVLYDKEGVYKRLGVYPEQIPDLKGLMGDSSDNYPGVHGIGPKTACTLITEFKTLENIYDHLSDIKNEKVKNLLVTYKDDAFLSKKLATIVTDISINTGFEQFEFKGFSPNLRAFFEKFEFKTLERKYFPAVKFPPPPKTEKKEKDQMSLF